MRDPQISQNQKKLLIASKELLFFKGCMYTYILEKLWRLHVISHEMICPEESDFGVGFRVIGCGHGAEISSFNAGDRFLESLDFLDRSFFWRFPCSQKWQNSDKMGHPWVSQEHMVIFYYGHWIYGLNIYLSYGHLSYKVSQSLGPLSLSWGRIFITHVQQSVLLRAV